MRKSALSMAAATAIFALAAADVAAAGTYASQGATLQRAVVQTHDGNSSYAPGGEVRLERVQNRSPRCRYVRKKHKRNGTVIGALTGGFLGSQVAGRGARTEGMLIGAGLGAVAGRQVGKSNARRRC